VCRGRQASPASQREVEPTARTETLKKLTTRRAYGSTHYSSWPDAACTRTHIDGGLARLEGPSRTLRENGNAPAPAHAHTYTHARAQTHALARQPALRHTHTHAHTHTHTYTAARARACGPSARAPAIHFVYLHGPRSRTCTQRLVETGSSVIHQSVRPKRHRPITVPNTCKHLHLHGAAIQYFMTHNYIIVVIRRGIDCGGGVLYLCHFSTRALIAF